MDTSVSNPSPDAGGNRIVVMVVDDEAELLAVLRRCLTRAGFTVIAATRGEEAVEQLGRHKVDVLISDLNMPGMTGADLLVHARKHFPDVPRIALTGSGGLDAVAKIINEAQVYRFFAKPCAPKVLEQAVRDALETRDRAPLAVPQSAEPASKEPASAQDAFASADTQHGGVRLAEYALDVAGTTDLCSRLRQYGLGGLAALLSGGGEDVGVTRDLDDR